MHDSLQWLADQIRFFGETTRQSRWHLDELQSHRSQLAGIWNDSCAEDMSCRFLNPQATNASESLDLLVRQLEHLQTVTEACLEAYASFEQGNRFAIEVERLSAESSNIFRTLDSLVSEVMRRVQACEQAVNESAECLEQAYKAGNL